MKDLGRMVLQAVEKRTKVLSNMQVNRMVSYCIFRARALNKRRLCSFSLIQFHLAISVSLLDFMSSCDGLYCTYIYLEVLYLLTYIHSCRAEGLLTHLFTTLIPPNLSKPPSPSNFSHQKKKKKSKLAAYQRVHMLKPDFESKKPTFFKIEIESHPTS